MVNKAITLEQMSLIVYHIGFQMSHYLPNLDTYWWHNKSNKIITYWDSFLTCSLFQQHTVCSKPNHHYINCGNNKQCHETLLISVQHVFITLTTFSFHSLLMKPTSSTKHSAVISLLQQGYSLHQIESENALWKSIIDRINKEMDGDKENSKGGHPSKLSSDNKQSIICQITSGRLYNPVEATHFINDIFPDSVTPQTAGNALKQDDFCAVVKRKCPLLKKAHRLECLKFARYHENWTVEDWKRILWSYKTKINRLDQMEGPILGRRGGTTFWQDHHSHSQAWRREQSYGMGLYGMEWSRGAYRGSGDHDWRAIL